MRIKYVYIILIFLAVLYDGEAWSLILSKEHKLRVLENRVLRRTSRSKREEITVKWNFCKDGFQNLYSTPNTLFIKSRRINLARHKMCRPIADRRVGYENLVVKREGRRNLESSRRRFKNNIKMEFQQNFGNRTGLLGLRIAMSPDAVKPIVTLQIPQKARNFFTN
jgi:hypothetical protein